MRTHRISTAFSGLWFFSACLFPFQGLSHQLLLLFTNKITDVLGTPGYFNSIDKNRNYYWNQKRMPLGNKLQVQKGWKGRHYLVSD